MSGRKHVALYTKTKVSGRSLLSKNGYAELIKKESKQGKVQYVTCHKWLTVRIVLPMTPRANPAIVL